MNKKNLNWGLKKNKKTFSNFKVEFSSTLIVIKIATNNNKKNRNNSLHSIYKKVIIYHCPINEKDCNRTLSNGNNMDRKNRKDISLECKKS